MTEAIKSVRVFFNDILLPFLSTRFLLLVGGLASSFFFTNKVENGWIFSQYRLIDIWARWDSGWYLSIIKDGYLMGKDVYSESNLAFFPVYPYLIKFILFFIPNSLRSDQLIVIFGLVLSNLFLLLSLIIIYRLSIFFFGKKSIAKNVIWLILVFPSSFFLSSFYTEATFLFFSVLAIWAGYQKKWWLAGISVAILGATRVVGLMIILPLFMIYLSQRKWDVDQLDKSIFWFGLMPLGLLSFFSFMADLTGDFLAPVKVQNAWGRNFTDPITSFFFPTSSWPLVTQVDQFSVLLVLSLSIWMLIKEKKNEIWPLAIYSILLIIPTLFTGTLDSATRFTIVIFPVFIYLAYLLEDRKNLAKVIQVILMIIQLVLFTMFSQFHWVG